MNTSQNTRTNISDSVNVTPAMSLVMQRHNNRFVTAKTRTKVNAKFISSSFVWCNALSTAQGYFCVRQNGLSPLRTPLSEQIMVIAVTMKAVA
jgi:hypothetical protein